MRTAKDPIIRGELEFYAEQLNANRGNPTMVRGLAANLRAGIELLRRLGDQETCPEEYKNSPRRIGLLPAGPEEWWKYYRPVVQHDVSVAEDLLKEFEQARGKT
jgi:hypothetical protein